MAYKDKEKNREYQRLWFRQQRIKNRLKAIEMLGGCCKECGVADSRVLQFDHIVPELRNKENQHNSYKNVSLILKGILTAKDIQLLCANCHAIKTYETDRKKFSNYIN